MRTANMPAGQGSDSEARDVERLAAAVDQGRFPESVDDPALAQDLRVIELMRVFGPDPALDPTPDARARARARLFAAMAEQPPRPAPPDATTPMAAAPAAAAPIGGDTSTSVTAQFQRIVADDGAEGPGGAPSTREVEREDGGTAAPDVVASRSRRNRHSMPARPAGRSASSARPPRRGLRGRVATTAVASLVVLVAVVVGGGLASRGALPGEALYAIKRVSEDVGLALAPDDRARAQRHLDHATTRVDEVEQLVARGDAGGVDAAVIEGVITDFDTATGEGTRTLLAGQEAPGPAVLGDLQAWASDQAARLSVLRPALPETALGEVDGSLALLDRLVGRTEALEARSDCAEVTSPVTDDLGPLAAESSCATAPADGAGVVDPPEIAPEGGSTPPSTTASRGRGPATDPTAGRPAPGGQSTDGPAPGGSAPDGPATAPSDEGLLPGIVPDELPLPDLGGSGGTDPDEDEDEDVSVPLPVVPPVEVPPLVPGLPGVSIG